MQAQKFGATIALPFAVSEIDCESQPFRLTLANQTTIQTKTIVVAAGARYRTLNFEHPFDNAGVYYAATAMEGGFCENEPVIVVGGEFSRTSGGFLVASCQPRSSAGAR